LADKEGKIKWLETIKTPIIGNKGRVIGVTGIGRDITSRKKLDAERRKTGPAGYPGQGGGEKNFSSLLHDETGSFALP